MMHTTSDFAMLRSMPRRMSVWPKRLNRPLTSMSGCARTSAGAALCALAAGGSMTSLVLIIRPSKPSGEEAADTRFRPVSGIRRQFHQREITHAKDEQRLNISERRRADSRQHEGEFGHGDDRQHRGFLAKDDGEIG